jgi:hypothetical protein
MECAGTADQERTLGPFGLSFTSQGWPMYWPPAMYRSIRPVPQSRHVTFSFVFSRDSRTMRAEVFPDLQAEHS